MREKDWSRTPLGSPDRWPTPLRTMVSTCLASRYPMFLWWGPELINIYNDAYAPLMGVKHPEGMGRPAWEVWAEIWDIVGPLAVGVIEGGEATWSEAQRLDLERSGYVEETYFDFAYSPVRDESGTVAGVLGVVSEITERVLAARRLQTLGQIGARTSGVDGVHEVARRAVQALEVNPHDLPFVLLYEEAGDELALLASVGLSADGERRLRRQPRRPLSGAAEIPLERALRRREQVVIDPLATAELSACDERRPRADKALVMAVEEPGERAPTLALFFALSARRALDDDLRRFCELVASAIGSAVADARALEEERARTHALAEIDRAKTEFFSNVSHEFRTPLTLLLGPLEDAVHAANPDPDLVMAHRNALRLLRHVNALLEYSRVQAGRAQAHPRPVDLAAMCRELSGLFGSAAERAGLGLELACGEGSVPVLADPGHLEQIVLNLLSNALKFTIEGAISVRVARRDGCGVLEVQDTGVGIAEGDLERLFERFHRVQDERARSHEGSGIGLALTKELVELQGGSIAVASRRGEGTTFTVTLPLGTETDALEPRLTSQHAEAFVAEALRWSDGVEADLGETLRAAARRPAADRDGARARVLVVDDNADMRDYLHRLLAPRYDVRTASDGEQALEILRGGVPVDLILSDVMMPRLDGFGLLRAIRSDRAIARTPVVLLSARAGEEAAVEGLDAGADDHVVKPFTARELRARVAANLELGALRNREAERTAEYAGRLEELLQREHAIAVTLQRSMLPERLDVGAFTQVGARYEPASQAMQVGGDFYDALGLDDGRVLLFIGDVAGHGLESAVVMGSMRAALRAYVLADVSPETLLSNLNAFALTRDGMPMITCQCVIVDADGHGASYATAGHPPGLIRHADGRVALLDGPPGPPLGLRPLARFEARHVDVSSGSSIVLYTDGLIERRGEPIDHGIDRLVRRVRAEAPAAPDALADRLIAAHRGAGFDDDIAVLVATVADPGCELELTTPASPGSLQPLRRTVRRWLAGQAIPAPDAYDVVFAANEAASNVVEHAYGLRQGPIQVSLRADADAIHVAVADRGRWRPSRADGGGRGLTLLDAVMDDVRLERDGGGSTVHMTKRRRGEDP